MNYLIFSSILMTLSILLICKVYKHFLMILMCLEFMVLIILFSMFMNLSFNKMEIYFLVFMVFFVIESVLGLSLLVCLVHFKGNDHVQNLTLMMW